MKKITILLIVLLLVGCGQSKPNVSEYSKDMYNLKGDVKSFIHATIDVEYNENASVSLFEMGYYSSANQVCKFDERGNNYATIEGDGYGGIAVKWSAEYDDNNFMINSKLIFEESGGYIKISYETDDKGNMIIEDHIALGLNQYIHEDEIIEESSISATFDKEGRVVRVSSDTDVYGMDGKPYLDYNKNGFVSDVYLYSDDEIYEHVTFNYNDKGFMSDYRYVVNQNSDIELLAFEYEYDEHDNWTKQIVTVDGLEKYIVTRTYIYRE